MPGIRRSFTASLLLAVVLVVAAITASSCLLPRYVTDPAAKTPGYKLFTGRTDGFHISFEYPDTWQRRTMEKYDTFRVIDLRPNETDTVSITSDVTAAKGGDFTNAGELVQHLLDLDSAAPEFRILSRTRVRLGQVEAEEVIYSYRFVVKDDPHLPPGTVINKVLVARELAVDYGERIYHVGLLADGDKYENLKEGFEHLIATFRFLE